MAQPEIIKDIEARVKIPGDTMTGNLTAPTFIGTLNGNADTATKLSSTRTISLTGDVSGSGTFDGSGDLSINATVADNSHSHNLMPAYYLGSTAGPYIYTDSNYNFMIRAGSSTAYKYLNFSSDGKLYINGVALANVNDLKSYLPLSGGTMTGVLGLASDKYGGPSGEYGMNCNNSDIVGINGLFTRDNATDFSEGLNFYRSSTTWDTMVASGGTFYFGSNVVFGAGLTGSANIMAGAATFNGCIYANRMDSVTTSFRWNKSGSYWGGIGYNGVYNENYFGPCDNSGNWIAIGDCGAEKWRFAGQLIIQSPTTSSVAYGSTNPTITFMNSDKSQNCSLIYTDYDAVRSPAGIALIGNQGNEWFQAPRIFGAVWNDYAEYRSSGPIEPGRVICETGNGTLKLSTERLQPGANVVSDTFGFAIGETENCKTPIAVSGRALVYTYEDRYSYEAGDPVCAAPDGTVSKMSREEVMMYPDRIVGTVSEIPEYERWGTGDVEVKNRIWIKVK